MDNNSEDPALGKNPIVVGHGRQCKSRLIDFDFPLRGCSPKPGSGKTTSVEIVVGEESREQLIESFKRNIPPIYTIPTYEIDYRTDNKPWHDRFKNNHKKRR